jgi:hypothetical protein
MQANPSHVRHQGSDQTLVLPPFFALVFSFFALFAVDTAATVARQSPRNLESRTHALGCAQQIVRQNLLKTQSWGGHGGGGRRRRRGEMPLQPFERLDSRPRGHTGYAVDVLFGGHPVLGSVSGALFLLFFLPIIPRLSLMPNQRTQRQRTANDVGK